MFFIFLPGLKKIIRTLVLRGFWQEKGRFYLFEKIKNPTGPEPDLGFTAGFRGREYPVLSA